MHIEAAQQVLAHGAGSTAGFLMMIGPGLLLYGLGILLIFPAITSGYARRTYEDYTPDTASNGNGNGNGNVHPRTGTPGLPYAHEPIHPKSPENN